MSAAQPPHQDELLNREGVHGLAARTEGARGQPSGAPANDLTS